MYITKTKDLPIESFDWNTYFIERVGETTPELPEAAPILTSVREMLHENNAKMTMALSKMMRLLLADVQLENPKMLELGAATGFLTRWFICQYGGEAVLVDNNEQSFEAYSAVQDKSKAKIKYVIEDLFKLELNEKFDLVSSFGLIEHFKDKAAVMEAHKKFLAPDGLLLIAVPMDSLLSRVFFEVHPEMNLGYRELLTARELKGILQEAGFEVLKVESSSGYVYDFVAALARVK